MSEETPDHQLTADDLLLPQIEALATRSQGSGAQDAQDAPPTSDPLDPGEPESARFEPDASQ